MRPRVKRRGDIATITWDCGGGIRVAMELQIDGRDDQSLAEISYGAIRDWWKGVHRYLDWRSDEPERYAWDGEVDR